MTKLHKDTCTRFGRIGGISRNILLLLVVEVDDFKLGVRLLVSELDPASIMLNMALVMSGQGEGVARPWVLEAMERLDRLW